MELSQIGKKTFIGKGNMSKCYLLEDGNVLKLFNNKRSVDEIGRFKYFLNYSNDSFVFPFEFIFDSKNFYGYITSFAKGISLENVFSTSNLLDLANSSFKLEKNIEYISKGGITLYDFHEGNLLYDGKDYSVIDFDETIISNDIDFAIKNNQEAHRVMIHFLFLENIKTNKYTSYILNKINAYKLMRIKPSEMIVKVKEDIDRFYKEDINTIDELKKVIRR